MAAQTLTSGSMDRKFPNWNVFFALLLILFFGAQSSSAQTAQPTRLVVRDSLGLTGIRTLCNLLGCSTMEGLGDPQGQLFMVKSLTPLDSATIHLLSLLPLGIVDIEPDQIVQTLELPLALLPLTSATRLPTLTTARRCGMATCISPPTRSSVPIRLTLHSTSQVLA